MGIFQRFDRDRSGEIDLMELRDNLYSLGYAFLGGAENAANLDEKKVGIKTMPFILGCFAHPLNSSSIHLRFA
ncbi:hypothetical protein COLO4_33286 [Corchorus olitorius]|uniref:EF-hand domain-containing protein n=1 Tax=Corchorus olitorius TaxID=93759 RepID=A0A1R3GV51_9ROSI|nr:hypothetical protein COLO4_33286 [Corchorus olitorius]